MNLKVDDKKAYREYEKCGKTPMFSLLWRFLWYWKSFYPYIIIPTFDMFKVFIMSEQSLSKTNQIKLHKLTFTVTFRDPKRQKCAFKKQIKFMVNFLSSKQG